MANRKHLIIGSGHGALSALKAIRGINEDDEIKVVTMEDYPPYSPTALPYLLAGRITQSNMWLVHDGFFQKMRSSFTKSKEVVQVTPLRKEVLYRDNDRDTYDTLLIATGSKPVIPPIKGLAEAGFLSLHTIGDCQRLLHHLKDTEEVAILGAGLIGVELAVALRERGHQIKVIEMENNILPLYFDGKVASYIDDVLKGHGIQTFTSKRVTEVRKKKGKTEIALSDGSALESDIFIIAVGVKPRISFLKGSGVNVNEGVVVDRKMKTNIDDIFAVGDVVESYDFLTRQAGLNAIITTAVTQGRVAGINMAGGDGEYQGWISMNVFHFFGHMACSVGLSLKEDQILEEANDDSKTFKKFVFQQDRLVGAMFMNHEIDPGVIRYLIEKRIDLGQYKDMLLEKPREISRWLMIDTERKGSMLVQA